jgi:hypothetical protein
MAMSSCVKCSDFALAVGFRVEPELVLPPHRVELLLERREFEHRGVERRLILVERRQHGCLAQQLRLGERARVSARRVDDLPAVAAGEGLELRRQDLLLELRRGIRLVIGTQ